MKNLTPAGFPQRYKTYLHFNIKTGASLLILLIGVNVFIDTAQASASLNAYAQQPGDEDPVSLVLGCLALLVILGGLILRFAYPNIAPTYNQKIKSQLPVSQVWAEIDTIFPKRAPAGQPWDRKRSKEDPHTLQLRAYPLPYWSGCLLMLFTGIIFGFIAWALMGRLEKVVIRPVKAGEGSTIQIGASGYGAVAKAKELAAVLAAG